MAGIESDFSAIRAEAELARDFETGYRDICQDREVTTLIDSIEDKAGNFGGYVNCSDHQDGYAAVVYLGFEHKYLCIDHTGYMGEVTLIPTAPDTCNNLN